MAGKYLGDEFDIHGGGLDLRFPHHENELAQSTAAGKPFARVWMHNALVTMRGEKMSKSLGNGALVTEVTQAYPRYKQDPDYVFPGGESFRQMQTRCQEHLEDMAAANPNQTLLLVAHAGVIRALVCHLLGLDLASNLRRKVSHRYIGDFRFEGRRCTYYDELGQPSGFARDGIITLPWTAPAA